MERALLTWGRSRRGLMQSRKPSPADALHPSRAPPRPRLRPRLRLCPAPPPPWLRHAPRLRHAPPPSAPFPALPRPRPRPGLSQPAKLGGSSVFPPPRKLTLTLTRGSEDHGSPGASTCISPRTPVPSWNGFRLPHPKGISEVTCPGPNPDGPPPESMPPRPGRGLVPTFFQPVLLLPTHPHPRLCSRLDLWSALT